MASPTVTRLRASRAYTIGTFTATFVDTGVAPEFRWSRLSGKIRRFAIAWFPRCPTGAEREAMHLDLMRATNAALNGFSRALGATGALLYGEMP